MSLSCSISRSSPIAEQIAPSIPQIYAIYVGHSLPLFMACMHAGAWKSYLPTIVRAEGMIGAQITHDMQRAAMQAWLPARPRQGIFLGQITHICNIIEKSRKSSGGRSPDDEHVCRRRQSERTYEMEPSTVRPWDLVQSPLGLINILYSFYVQLGHENYVSSPYQFQ